MDDVNKHNTLALPYALSVVEKPSAKWGEARLLADKFTMVLIMKRYITG
jgi:hypothetical protein